MIHSFVVRISTSPDKMRACHARKNPYVGEGDHTLDRIDSSFFSRVHERDQG